jgi:DNA polymerase III subunit alpha
MFLIFDTETTGFPKDWNAPITDLDNWPRVVQLAWQIHDENGELVEVQDHIIYPDGFDIPFNATKVHGISTERAKNEGRSLADVLTDFEEALEKCEYLVGHNVNFDLNVTGCEYYRVTGENPLDAKKSLDSCTETTAKLCELPGGRGGRYKLPKLEELHRHLFGEGFAEAHNAAFDVEATARVFLELLRIKVITPEAIGKPSSFLDGFYAANTGPIASIGLAVDEARKKREKGLDQTAKKKASGNADLHAADVEFAHLHNHSQFSILQATTVVSELVRAAVDNGHAGVALTDLGNIMGAFHFNRAVMGVPGNREAYEHNQKVKSGTLNEPLQEYPFVGIIGCEFFVCEDRLDRSKKDDGYQIVLLAKNKNGYHNLAKLSSEGMLNGFYYVPRIDKSYLLEHKEDLIVLSGGLRGEIQHLYLNVGEEQAREALEWWRDQFGDDFYLELNRHRLEEEDHVNLQLLSYAKEYGIKYIAANNTFYLTQENAEAHDILLCVKEGAQKSTPIGRGRGFRYGFPNQEFYFKTKEEMVELFSDLPEALNTTKEIIDKVELYPLERDVLLPEFDIPEEFQDPQDKIDSGQRGENAYLRHLTYVGAKTRYEDLTPEITERLDFELETIARTGYPGYFLIVQDFCEAARQMDVSVGPGRGSAAGSAVAYCTGITNVDPIKYDLLFERFLNPERVSLPDIDIDFDDEGRDKVIQYVIDKYGASQVAQIITYGTMAAKSSIRDAGRVLELPLPDTDRIAKLIPDMTKLKKLWELDDKELRSKFGSEEAGLVQQLKALSEGDTLEATTINQARVLEGSLRNTGIHACGVIITPSDIRELVPVARAKDSEMWCTQFDNSVVEDAGLLKMDFLGLRTLTIIKEACRLIKQRHNVVLDPDSFPLDDIKTYELFQRGETVGIFQYESAGMQKYLKELKPTEFADLIAMNALYRPGPLEYIPEFIERKHGRKEIVYDLDAMEGKLKETYGITVYQEQVMLLSQELAGFTKGQADILRKGMGKKQKHIIDKLKPMFLDGGEERGHNRDVLEKVWKDWEAFASYAFNKSHSTCYAWVAFQTAYLKAHYPAEFMASVLSNNMSDLKTVTFFMEECRRIGVPVLGPSVNESLLRFSVNPKGAVRFGMGGMKGVGENAVREIISQREDGGQFKNLFDLLERIDLRQANRKTIECLILGGAMDDFEGTHRAMYFSEEEGGRSFVEKAIKYVQGKKNDSESAQASLFGEGSGEELPPPTMPVVPEWPSIVALKKEKEINGMYLSSHPLDDYRTEIKYFCNASLSRLNHVESILGREVTVAGIVTDAQHRISKMGKGWGIFRLEDFHGDYEFKLFGEDYLKFRHFFDNEQLLYIKARGRKFNQRQGEGFVERLSVDVAEVRLLSEVLEESSKSLEIKLNLQWLTTPLVDELHELLSLHPGKKRVKLHVIDAEEKLDIKLPVKEFKVTIAKDLLQVLEQHEHLQPKVIS